MMINPVRSIREELDLSVDDLCLIADCSYMTVSRIENGKLKSVPQKLLKTFDRLGFDSRDVEEAYASWRKAKAQQLIEAYKKN